MLKLISKITLSTIFFSALVFAKESLMVSILPQKMLLDEIIGDKMTTEVMVEIGQNPHTYEPKPSQMSSLSNAKIYFSIGIEFEDVWLKKFANLNKNMKIVDSSKGIERIPMIKHKYDHNHNHNYDHKKVHKYAHNKNKLDPHVWLSPQNAKIIAKNMYEEIVKIDSKNGDFYRKNYGALIAKLDNLDKEIKEILSSLPPHSKFMVFHPSWGYFAKDYGLIQLPVEIEGKTPKAKDVAKLIDEARSNRVKVIFAQPEFTKKFANIIAKEGGIEVVSISPLAPNLFATLRNFAKALAKGYE